MSAGAFFAVPLFALAATAVGRKVAADESVTPVPEAPPHSAASQEAVPQVAAPMPSAPPQEASPVPPVNSPPLSLNGRWSAGPMTERWTVSSWGPECGSPPRAQTLPAEEVAISQEGAELVIRSPSRIYSTLRCYEPLPGLVRRSHSGGRRSWSNLCESAAGDPRQASIHTNVNATDDRIDFVETASYEFSVDGRLCSSSSARSRSYRLLERTTPVTSRQLAPRRVPQTAKAALTPGAPEPCRLPGPVARLEIEPTPKVIRPGDNFRLSASGRDAAGCRVAGQPRWTLSSEGPTVELLPSGLLAVAPDSGEGRVVARAALAHLTTELNVQVVSREHYETLLSANGAAPGSGSVSAEQAIASRTLGAERGRAEDGAASRKILFVALVSGIAALLSVVGLWLLRRGRHGAAPTTLAEQAAQAFAAVSGSWGVAQASSDDADPTEADMVPDSGRVCPCCGALYADRFSFCGKDGAALLQVN